MKSMCDGNKDRGGGIHCVCYKCKLECPNNKTKEEHQHRWRCDRIGRDELAEMFERQSEEMKALTHVLGY